MVATTAGATFAVMVGSGGAYDGQPPTHAYGFGGSGEPIAAGSGGGGLSGVFLGSGAITATSTARAVLVAGGGGAGGGNACSGCFSLGGQGGGSLTVAATIAANSLYTTSNNGNVSPVAVGRGRNCRPNSTSRQQSHHPGQPQR